MRFAPQTIPASGAGRTPWEQRGAAMNKQWQGGLLRKDA